MKKWRFMLYFTAIIVIVLSGCSGKENSAASGDSKEKSSGNIETADYEEITTLDLEGPVTNISFSLDEDGDTLFWGENDGGIGEDLRRNVWVDEKVKNLDIEVYDHFSHLSKSGHIITTKTDFDAPVEEKHSIIEYDPSTDKTETFTATNDRDDILHPGYGTYIKDPRTYIHTVTSPNRDNAETYLWKLDSNEFIDLKFLSDIKKEVGEITSYPHFYLTKDASKVYAIVLNAGIFSYDSASEKTEKLLDAKDIIPQDKYTTNLTSDEKYMVYGINEPDAEAPIVYHALNLDSKETVEISKGSKIFTLTDGNVIVVDESDVNYFDFETGKLETIYKIDLKENQELDNVTVSIDGNTIAYGYTTQGEDEEEDISNIKILSNK